MTKRKVRTTINPEQELEVDQAEASRLKELDILASDVPVKVASTRVDGGPGTEVALRAAGPLTSGPLGLGPTHDIQTTMRPDLTITVDDAEYQQLLAEGLVYSGTPQSPAADFYDSLFADKVQHGTATPTALRAAFVPKWKPSTAYASGEPVLNPSGQIVTANSAFTSGTTYSGTNWTVVSGGGASLPTQTGQSGKFLTTDGTAASWGSVPAGYTDEQAQDAAAGLFSAGTHSGITFAYNDAGNALSATVINGITQTSQSGTAYTFVIGDSGTLVEFTNAAAVTATIPPNASVNFPVGTTLSLRQYGAGQVTVANGLGVTLRSRGNAVKTAGQYAEASLTQRAVDEWILSGDVA